MHFQYARCWPWYAFTFQCLCEPKYFARKQVSVPGLGGTDLRLAGHNKEEGVRRDTETKNNNIA